VYERGLQALQSKQYDKAIQLLQSVIDLFADEKELHERARLYLNVALRHSRPPDSTPHGPDERLYAATLKLNAGRYDEALELLTALERDVPPDDHVQFVLAMVHLHRGDPAEALRRLVRAVELNPANRHAAMQDAELAPLREDPGFRDTIEAAAARGRRLAGRAPR
jgi:tetratricopeptide (TPR) repeat protein